MPRAPRPATIVVLTLLVATSAAAQEPIRLEFRIMPQSGTPMQPAGAGITNLPLTSPGSPLLLVSTGTLQRFTVQYRVLDLDTVEQSFVPAGLSAASVNIALSNPAAGTLERAQLTRFQSVLASTIPPTDVDTSGLPTGTAAMRRGLHAPFRGGMADQNNNDLPSNGTVIGSSIVNILPLSISQNNQGNANNGLDNTAWYGLYTFNLVTNPGFAGLVNITAEATADPVTGNRFGWFNDGIAVPVQSQNAATGTAYIAIIPSPSALCTTLLGMSILGRRRSRHST